jgi:hypothetical protein
MSIWSALGRGGAGAVAAVLALGACTSSATPRPTSPIMLDSDGLAVIVAGEGGDCLDECAPAPVFLGHDYVEATDELVKPDLVSDIRIGADGPLETMHDVRAIRGIDPRTAFAAKVQGKDGWILVRRTRERFGAPEVPAAELGHDALCGHDQSRPRPVVAGRGAGGRSCRAPDLAAADAAARGMTYAVATLSWPPDSRPLPGPVTNPVAAPGPGLPVVHYPKQNCKDTDACPAPEPMIGEDHLWGQCVPVPRRKFRRWCSQARAPRAGATRFARSWARPR